VKGDMDMKYAIMRPITERERLLKEFAEDERYTRITSCPTQKDAEILLKALEKHSFLAHLSIDTD
jgi:hypothetical protein